MAGVGIRAIRIVKGDLVVNVHGQGAGAQGVVLAADQVHGIYDAPIKTTYKSGAFQEGSSHRFTKKMQRDMELGFHIQDTFTSYEFNDSQFRQMFDYEQDRWDPDYVPTTIEVDTTLSGIRKLDVFMYEDPDFTPSLDPISQQFGNVILKLRAPDPMWYEDQVITSFDAGTTSASGHVTVENPTDNILYQKWILTQANWSVADYQWVGAKGARAPGGADGARLVKNINVTAGNGGITVDLDRTQLMYRDANDTNALGQFGATKIFNYAVPPYTPATDLVVSYTSAPSGGAMAQLVMPKRWSRPWGLEILNSTANVLGAPQEQIFTADDFTYQIPTFADMVDYAMLSGGGGGDGGTLGSQHGGGAAVWATGTLVRGDDIPWATDKIIGFVGAGGKFGNALRGWSPQNGGTSRITADGMSDRTSTPGGGGAYTAKHTGHGPGSVVYNGRAYYGGEDCSILGQDGVAPGGGGSAGFPLGPGGYGARGVAHFYAYQSGSG